MEKKITLLYVRLRDLAHYFKVSYTNVWRKAKEAKIYIKNGKIRTEQLGEILIYFIR